MTKLGEYVLAERDTNINKSLLSNPSLLGKQTKIKAYPNPANNEIMLGVNEELSDVSILILDYWGREMRGFKKENWKEAIKINLQEYSTGVYFYIVESKEGQFSGRFIKD
ncbi:MAG: T9SS type A sorting domain-containing protein [Flavobacteriales bacterium]